MFQTYCPFELSEKRQCEKLLLLMKLKCNDSIVIEFEIKDVLHVFYSSSTTKFAPKNSIEINAKSTVKPLNKDGGVAEACSNHVSKSFDVGNFICDFQYEGKQVHQLV